MSAQDTENQTGGAETTEVTNPLTPEELTDALTGASVVADPKSVTAAETLGTLPAASVKSVDFNATELSAAFDVQTNVDEIKKISDSITTEVAVSIDSLRADFKELLHSIGHTASDTGEFASDELTAAYMHVDAAIGYVFRHYLKVS